MSQQLPSLSINECSVNKLNKQLSIFQTAGVVQHELPTIWPAKPNVITDVLYISVSGTSYLDCYLNINCDFSCYLMQVLCREALAS